MIHKHEFSSLLIDLELNYFFGQHATAGGFTGTVSES
jgi:hypothetical protein